METKKKGLNRGKYRCQLLNFPAKAEATEAWAGTDNLQWVFKLKNPTKILKVKKLCNAAIHT